MNLEQFSQVGEVIAAIAVVVSLVYLAIQLRQNTEQMRSQAFDLVTGQRTRFLRPLVDNGELSRIVTRGLGAVERLDASEYFRFGMYLYGLFVDLELGFKKWRAGQLGEEEWRAWEAAVLWWLRTPGAAAWWKTAPTGFTPTFITYIDGLMEQPDPEPDKTSRIVAMLASAGK